MNTTKIPTKNIELTGPELCGLQRLLSSTTMENMPRLYAPEVYRAYQKIENAWRSLDDQQGGQA